MAKSLFNQRKSLDQITEVPNDIISVYVVENHIWADGGSREARRDRQAEIRTVDEFLIDPVRPFLNDVFRQMAAPYDPKRKDNPIGQGYWIQAEFGSGKSHLLSFLGTLALGGKDEWQVVKEKEENAGIGRRESLHYFYENGLAKKNESGKGILVAVKTLVGQGGGAIGVSGSTRSLTEYILDAVSDQYYQETGRALPLYPTQILAQRFLTTEDFERYRSDLTKYLRDPIFFDEEEQEDISEFLDDLQNNPDPGIQRDCGQRLWDFYETYLRIKPKIPMEAEDVLEHMMLRLLAEGYAGLLLILDEVSLFMKGRSDAQRVEDEKALVVLSNRLAKVKNLPVWTVCAAQQAIESKMAGVKNIIARERLDLVPLLNKQDYYYDIALARVREITDVAAIDQYYEDYRRSFSWPEAVGRERFAHFFPYYPSSIDVVRTVSYSLTTVRSALYFMLQTLKTQRKRQSQELISLWSLFDDVVEYEEDPSGTTKGIASIKTKWPNEWKAYETAKHQLDTITKGHLKIYRSRCEKIIKTLFLYHVADMAPNGLSVEELMNSVMEWKDHDKAQEADRQDNLDHYEILADQIASELAQVSKVGANFRFNPAATMVDPRDHFQRARAEAEQNEVLRLQAWEALLALDGWQVTSSLMTLDLAYGLKSIFRDVAPSSQKDYTIKWHGREINGRVYMRDLLDISTRNAMLPNINSPETGLDFSVYISSMPAVSELAKLVENKKDGRILFWSPDALTATDQSLLIDFAAYRSLVADFRSKDTEEAKMVLQWVLDRLRDQMGTIYRMVPDSYSRGRIAALDHADMPFISEGELTAILTPLVEQILDAVYVSKEMVFTAPAPFNDTNAVNAINGIVRVGEISRGARPTKEISAAQNYGFALRIMRRPNDKKLDISECRYTDDILSWIREKLTGSGATMPMITLYKNFMGVGGPDGLNYGLSKRMVQLYLLCLVREGKVRVSLSGKRTPVDAIDYGNLADIVFKVAVLDAFDQVQLLKPPEGWELLAPYAAIILEDEGIKDVRQDAQIQLGLQRLQKYKLDNQLAHEELRAGLDRLIEDVGQTNPLAERLTQWQQFLVTPTQDEDPIALLLYALDNALGYNVYGSGRVQQTEVDDLATRMNELKHATVFYGYRERLRAAARFAALSLADDPKLQEIQEAFTTGDGALKCLDKLMLNESRLTSELLDPMESAIESYGVRYLQLFDKVTGHTVQVRKQIADLSDSPVFVALGRLAQVEQLGGDPRSTLKMTFVTAVQGLPSLFPPDVTRAEVQRNLREWPQPPECPLTVTNAGEWIQRADDALDRCHQAISEAMLEKAGLLHSQALRDRLAQGEGAPFIDGLLEAKTREEVAEYLIDKLGSTDAVGANVVKLLQRYLKKIQVRKVRLADFKPSKRTLEASDVNQIAEEFKDYLSDALTAADDELPIVELE